MNMSPDTQMEPQKIHVNGVELHYIEQGTGEPLVLVHGGTGDYRYWEPQLGPFSQHFHVVSYSRRYSYPNRNPVIAPDHSVFAEAEDLATLISQLKLGRGPGGACGASAERASCASPDTIRGCLPHARSGSGAAADGADAHCRRGKDHQDSPA
jgi:hypothetical protein